MLSGDIGETGEWLALLLVEGEVLEVLVVAMCGLRALAYDLVRIEAGGDEKVAELVLTEAGREKFLAVLV